MKSLKLIFVGFCVLMSSKSFAQHALFAKTGVVHYDKTLYLKNVINKQFIQKADAGSKVWFDQMATDAPENVVLKKTLKFDGSKTVFENVKLENLSPKVSSTIQNLALDLEGITYSDLTTKSYKRYNDFFGEKIIIEDSTKAIKWRITDEYRDVAGYTCRRANGLTPDSIYVIGFYTTEIPVSGGPESINGLPGLILGLVVPSHNLSYFASKVELMSTVNYDINVFDNKKNKIVNRQQLVKQLSSTFDNGFMSKSMVDYIMELLLF